MSMQQRSDERSKALHREIAKKLRSDPRLWSVPRNNIQRWKMKRKNAAPPYAEWESILDQYSREQILNLLESDSEESVRLRSSSPFTGILTDEERKRIFQIFRKS